LKFLVDLYRSVSLTQS